MGFINATPHELNVVEADGFTIRTVPISGVVVRVETTRTEANFFGNVKAERVEFGPLEDVSSAYVLACHHIDHAVIIVSGMALSHPDLPADTNHITYASPGALVRNEHGQPIGCLGLTVR